MNGVPVTQLLIVWVGVMAGLLVTPRGRATLVRGFADMRHVLGFDRRVDMGRRWVELAAAEDAADPALRRCTAVKDAYLVGEFGPEELDWRILLALMPPPGRDPKMLNWAMAQKATQERMMVGGQIGYAKVVRQGVAVVVAPAGWRSFRELHAVGGYVGTFCDCGHDMNRHYDGGCNDCDAAWSPREPLPTEPDPRLVSYGEHLGLRPPKPANPVKPTRRESRQSHG